MSKRASLSSALDAATTAKGAKPGAVAKPSKGVIGNQSGRETTTGITIARADLELLRAVAASRLASGASTRNSVSDVIGSLIKAARGKLESEAGPFLKGKS